jgi:hypothetical protein
MELRNQQNANIFTICAITDPLGDVLERRSRTFGWFPDLKKAQKRVLEDDGNDIYEHWYTYAVIEEFPSGILALRKNEWWYKWNRKQKKYCPIKKPKVISNVWDWGMN